MVVEPPDAAEWSREQMRTLSHPSGTEFDRDGETLVVELERP
ncbi:poly-gamma-glutamate synthesis protein (capsule biosynthesis protein) [Natronobacterium gregoryi]|uniref:Capsule synthesis protein, CapA n=2 Tax=Natronobacterium gregoryi TaxID=44930 RepID=L0AK98_NATGS|nr:hypothetical protein Natgr_2418 [Natronobacterium gregoryi SP2]ELY68149.1 Capsule synthesis protein, CapA [Natronobacterium gregoryi SP2]SFJ34904.1 poly-gamma-glutamate synthesis protein (capsule biosynthesis protein) [Natronobacterium gregoryi]